MSSHRRDVAPKHRKKSRHLAPALWVGGFLLLGVVVALIALAPSADPLEEPNVVPGAAPVDFQERLSIAQATSRDQDRLERFREQQRQERIEARKERRQEARQEARRQERQEAREVVQTESPTSSTTTSVPTSTQSTQTKASGSMPALLQTIRSHESGGNYSAYNASGCEGYGCGGAYQMHARYAAEWAARAGYPGLSGQAQTWPPATQDAVALHLFYSTNPDGAHWCNWVTYC